MRLIRELPSLESAHGQVDELAEDTPKYEWTR
jgi:hypothetical protein